MNRVNVHLLCLLSVFVFVTAVSEEDCETENKNSICLKLDECDYYAKDLLKANGKPYLCAFYGQDPWVCCPKFSIDQTFLGVLESPGRKSADNCRRYYAWYNTAVSVGTPALSTEFRHMAILGYGENTTEWLCGGTLISKEYVLTAAHCLYSEDLGSVKRVRLGELDIKSTTDFAMPEDYGIAETFAHPNYQSPSHYNDIALIKLDRNVQFGPFIYPACLYTEYDLPQDEVLILTGWGQTEYFGERSSHLLKANLDYISHQKCAKSFSSASLQKLSNGIIDEIQICAGSEDGRDACPGDSGGPLHVMRYEYFRHHSVVGVTSFGKACGVENSVGVYTRVAPFTEWIENIVWP